MKLLYIVLVATVFIGSFLLGFKVRAKELGIKLYDIGSASALPVFSGNKSFPVLSGQGIIAVDASSNVTLYEKSADQVLYPASTTKIITALVALDYYKADEVLTVTNPNVEGQRMGLMVNEKMTFDNLINGLLIYSANDAAVTLSDNYPGGRDAFVAAMNAKVAELHLMNSHFANPVGLDDMTQVTTARDMVRVAEISMQNPVFAKIVGTKEKIVADVSGKYTYDLINVNTEAARENLITNVVRNGHNIFIAILGSEDRFGETKELIDWLYGSYTWIPTNFTTLSSILK